MKKIVIALHGLKPVKYDDMKVFKENYSQKLNKEFLWLEYFYNNKIEDLTIDEVILKVDKLIKQNSDSEITLFGYSLGALLALIISTRYNNIKNVLLLTPPLSIKENVLQSGIEEFNKRAKNRFDLEYDTLVKDVAFQEENLINLYPDKLLDLFNKMQKEAISNIPNIAGKRIVVLNATNDEIINVAESRIISSELSKHNFLFQKDLNSSHFFNKFKNENFNIVVEELNNF